MITQKSYYPACAIAFLSALFFGIVTIGQIYSLKDTYPVSKLWTGADYMEVYNGTRCYVSGVSLYENIWLSPSEKLLERMESLGLTDYIGISDQARYCYPPLPACLNYPLSLFDMETASQLMFFILILAVIGAYFLIGLCFESIRGRERITVLLCGLVIVALSHPFYFMIHRGHQVGIVFLLLGMGVYLLKRENFLCSICFAFAIGMIVFPVLIFIPLLLFRRYLYAVLTLVFFVLLTLISPDLWLEFVQMVLLKRFGTGIAGGDNCSLANTCRFFAMFVNNFSSSLGLPQLSLMHVREYALAVYALLLCAMVIADVKIRKKCGAIGNEAEICLTLMYFPFMIAIPETSFHYNLVLLILLVPALCSLVRVVHTAVPPFIVWAIAGGIFLSQMQVRIVQNLIDEQGSLFYFFPAFGLFLVMTGCVVFKWWFACACTHRVSCRRRA